MDQLPAHTRVKRRLEEVRQLHGGGPFTSHTFMAVCLWKADKDRFEIDFPNVERYCEGFCYTLFVYLWALGAS
jgi:hypothetical protein